MLSTHLWPNPILAWISLTDTHSVHSWKQESLVTFLNMESCYSLSDVLQENVMFWSHKSYLTFRDDNKILLSYLSISHLFSKMWCQLYQINDLAVSKLSKQPSPLCPNLLTCFLFLSLWFRVSQVFTSPMHPHSNLTIRLSPSGRCLGVLYHNIEVINFKRQPKIDPCHGLGFVP